MVLLQLCCTADFFVGAGAFPRRRLIRSVSHRTVAQSIRFRLKGSYGPQERLFVRLL